MTIHPLVKTTYANVLSLYNVVQKSAVRPRRHVRAWHYLTVTCIAFWLLFGGILAISAFPFLIVALITLPLLSLLIIVLARAYQNNL